MPNNGVKRHKIEAGSGTTSPRRQNRARQEFERKCAGKGWQETGLVFTSTIGTPLDARNPIR